MLGLVEWWLDSHCPVAGLPSLSAAFIWACYIVVIAVACEIVPGKTVQGLQLADGSTLQYKCNGLRVLALVTVALAVGVKYGLVSATLFADFGGDLFSTDLAMTIVISSVLYVSGVLSSSKKASFKPHTTSNPLRDWWCGVQLNPHIFNIDIKFFWIRLGMMTWLFINLSLAVKQAELRGTLSLPMILYQLFTGFYVLDYFWNEEYMTTTWDIIAENFGFMLCFGDIVWIPFTFSIQAWWLLKHDVTISVPFATFITLLFVGGYCVFRGSNKQKHDFKHDPSAPIWGKPPRTVGKRLLISGYWGWARHCNYLGDLMLALSYGLPCGFTSSIPYFYFAYLFILLILRERRDEARCRAKYKEIWLEYCEKVPWRILPYVY